MSDNEELQERLANALRRDNTRARWAFFAAHLLLAILFTLTSWILVLTGTEPLGSGPIFITLLAFLGCIMHLRSTLADSGMVSQSAAEILAQEIARQGIDINTLLAPQKRKRLIHLDDEGEVVEDEPADKLVQRSNARSS